MTRLRVCANNADEAPQLAQLLWTLLNCLSLKNYDIVVHDETNNES